MTSPQKGFKKVFPHLVSERPGLSSGEYAQWALQDGRATSNSKDPVFSLRSTAEKEYREGRLPTVKKVAGRYYPIDFQVSEGTTPKKDHSFVVMPSEDAMKDLDLLAEVKEWTRSDAVNWLIDEGRKARRPDLDNLKIVWEDIKRLKRSAKI